MKYLYSYFSLCVKRALKSYVAIFITTVLLVASLFLVGQMILNINNNDISRQRIKIGIAGDLEGTHLGIGIKTLESLDNVTISIEFIEMTEPEAQKALEKAEITGYAVIPENYIRDIVRGKDVKLPFVMSSSAAAAPEVLVREVIDIISPLLTDSEAGIYAINEYMEEKPVKNASSYRDDLNLKYIDVILNRDDTMDMREVGISSITITEYYIFGIMTFFLLVFGISCCTLFGDKRLAQGRLLRSKNAKVWHLVASEYMAYLVIAWITMSMVMPVSGLLLDAIYGNHIDVSMFLWLSLLSLPCIIMITAMQYLVYEATAGIITGVLAQFIMAITLGYVSGCFYPYQFFPETMQNIGGALPSGILFGFLRKFIIGDFSSLAGVWGVSFAYAAIFLVLAGIIRKRRLQGESV